MKVLTQRPMSKLKRRSSSSRLIPLINQELWSLTSLLRLIRRSYKLHKRLDKASSRRLAAGMVTLVMDLLPSLRSPRRILATSCRWLVCRWLPSLSHRLRKREILQIIRVKAIHNFTEHMLMIVLSHQRMVNARIQSLTDSVRLFLHHSGQSLR